MSSTQGTNNPNAGNTQAGNNLRNLKKNAVSDESNYFCICPVDNTCGPPPPVPTSTDPLNFKIAVLTLYRGNIGIGVGNKLNDSTGGDQNETSECVPGRSNFVSCDRPLWSSVARWIYDPNNATEPPLLSDSSSDTSDGIYCIAGTCCGQSSGDNWCRDNSTDHFGSIDMSASSACPSVWAGDTAGNNAMPCGHVKMGPMKGSMCATSSDDRMCRGFGIKQKWRGPATFFEVNVDGVVMGELGSQANAGGTDKLSIEIRGTKGIRGTCKSYLWIWETENNDKYPPFLIDNRYESKQENTLLTPEASQNGKGCPTSLHKDFKAGPSYTEANSVYPTEAKKCATIEISPDGTWDVVKH